MDIYGIGNALRSMVTIYQEIARRSGRTSLLLSTVKDGDCVIFTAGQEAARVRDLARERGIIIQIRVCNPTDSNSWIHEVDRNIKGRVLFDHSWIEKYYQYHIDNAEERLKSLMEHLNKQHDAAVQEVLQPPVRKGSSGYGW